MLEGAELLYKLYWHRKILMRRYKRIKGFSKPKVKRIRERKPIPFKIDSTDININSSFNWILVFSCVVVLAAFWFKLNQRHIETVNDIKEMKKQISILKTYTYK